MKKIKKYKKPQDIFIVGQAYRDLNKWKRDVKITDDETSFYLKNENNLIDMVSDGSISILNKQEFKYYIDQFIENLGDVILVKNFVGEIKIGVCTWVEDGDFSKTKIIDIPIYLNEYITHSEPYVKAISEISDDIILYLSFDGKFEIEKIDFKEYKNSEENDLEI